MKRDYNDPAYNDFRKRVLRRDKFTCHMCGAIGRKARLNVDHIIKWSSAASLRYDVENGIALCWNCHKEITGKESHYITYFTSLIQKRG